MSSRYEFVLELFRRNGEALGRVPLPAEWAEPAIESARLSRLRALGDWMPGTDAVHAPVPIWHPEHGEPHVSGFRVGIGAIGEWSTEFASDLYFADVARACGERLVKDGTLTTGEAVLFRASAFARATPAPAPSRFAAVDRLVPLPLRDTSLDALLFDTASCGSAHDDDFDVLFPGHTLDEADTLTRAAADHETGGILIGYLHRDPDTLALCAEVTAQIPAKHTTGHSTSLTFTSDTWTDVRAAIALRRRDEIMLGYWHSHPAFAWCKDCPVERQRACHLAQGFLSSDDTALHRLMFPRAYTLALVMTHTIDGVTPTLFGWRDGVLQPRAFRMSAVSLHS